MLHSSPVERARSKIGIIVAGIARPTRMVVVAVHLVGIGEGIWILVTVRLLVLLRRLVVVGGVLSVTAVVTMVELRPLQ